MPFLPNPSPPEPPGFTIGPQGHTLAGEWGETTRRGQLATTTGVSSSEDKGARVGGAGSPTTARRHTLSNAPECMHAFANHEHDCLDLLHTANVRHLIWLGAPWVLQAWHQQP